MKPQLKITTTPGLPAEIKTMFYTEGNSAASLHTSRLGRRKVTNMEFLTAEAALAWCRKNACNLFYMPVNISNQ